MQTTPAPVSKLIDAFSRLPGIGPKTASRLTFYLLRNPEDYALTLAEALRELHEKDVFCSQCFNIAEYDPCIICSDEQRDHTIICVVEEPLDMLAIERTRDYHGLYHVLHGHIAPAEGIGPEDLKIAELVERVRMSAEPIREVIVATNPNLEGEATARYVARYFQGESSATVKVTHLARGLPIGGDLEYADEITLSRALSGRSPL
jgi:recombination protein RecR